LLVKPLHTAFTITNVSDEICPLRIEQIVINAAKFNLRNFTQKFMLLKISSRKQQVRDKQWYCGKKSAV
jgi:hypothetical protein